jgi:hypothetical protein
MSPCSEREENVKIGFDHSVDSIASGANPWYKKTCVFFVGIVAGRLSHICVHADAFVS